MKNLQKLGKSLMLPVACLPIAAVLLGIGYWLDPSGWGEGSQIAAFLISAGNAIIGSMPILFVLGVSVGMADENDGAAGLAGLISWLLIQSILSPQTIAMISKTPLEDVSAAFGKIDNVFIGIICGLIGAICYNRFKNTKLPDALAFFSGKRSVALVAGGVSIVTAMLLLFVWPVVYGGLVMFGSGIMNLGAVGAGIYGFFNRLLLPLGLHHALNSVFWFDVAGINDLENFWSNTGEYGVTGQYMTGFFPIMMFGLPGAALAMLHTAKDKKKKAAAGLLLSASFAAFLTGVTEPLEFAFMFLAPPLYVLHAALTAISMGVMAALPVRTGFNFSGGLIDLVLCWKTPMAQNPWGVFVAGAVFFVIYYVLFRMVITKFNLKTPGREDDDDVQNIKDIKIKSSAGGAKDFTVIAEQILAGLGGAGNIASLDNCITRLRVEVKNHTDVNEKAIKSAGISGVVRPGKTSVQVVVGTQVQHVADEMRKLL